MRITRTSLVVACLLAAYGCGTGDTPGLTRQQPLAGLGQAQAPNLGLLGGSQALVVPFTPAMNGSAGHNAPILDPVASTPKAGQGGAKGSAGKLAPTGTAGAQAPATGTGMPTIPVVTADCPKFVNGTITFMGLGGITIVAGTKAANPSAPMVFYWHGTGSTAGEYASMAAAVQQGVVSEGGVLVSFQGTTGGDLLSGTSIFGKGDFALADQLLACAVRDHNVDPRRVFTTGCSAGGLFAAAMAAARSGYIAAAASNSGGWTTPVAWENAHTPALMTIHGGAADMVFVTFSETSATADKAFKARNGFVVNCNHMGQHCGGAGLAPDIWTFFKAHPYGVDPEPWSAGLPSGFNAQCKIYQ